MKCRKCGAELRDTDTFCPNCGEKVDKENDIKNEREDERRCPKCGALLREGIRFCPKCGLEVGSGNGTAEPEDDDIPVVKLVETKDIPFDDIEKNIIFETKQQVKSRDFKSGEKRKPHPINPISDQYQSSERNESYEHESRPKRRPDENIERNRDDDRIRRQEYDGEEDEEDDDSTDKMKLPIIIVAILIAVVLVVLFVKMKGVIGGEEAESAVSTTQAEGAGGKDNEKAVGQIEITSDVNIRNKPSKDGSDVIGKAESGETYDYYGYGDDSKNWVWIKLSDGTNGYIYKDYVKITK